VFPATVTVSGCTFTSNSVSLHGDGIDNVGVAAVSGCTFTSNSASSSIGGLNNETGGVLTQFDNQFINDQPPDVIP
jgi:hypothetical protein